MGESSELCQSRDHGGAGAGVKWVKPLPEMSISGIIALFGVSVTLLLIQFPATAHGRQHTMIQLLESLPSVWEKKDGVPHF